MYGYHAVDIKPDSGEEAFTIRNLKQYIDRSLDWVVRNMLCRNQDAMSNREEIKATARSANRDRKQFGLDSRRNWRYMREATLIVSDQDMYKDKLTERSCWCGINHRRLWGT